MFQYIGDFDSLGKGGINVAENGKYNNETDLHLVFACQNLTSFQEYIRRSDRSYECEISYLLSAHGIFPENA